VGADQAPFGDVGREDVTPVPDGPFRGRPAPSQPAVI